jgi:hypothetical protein
VPACQDQTDQGAQPWRLDGGAGEHFCFAEHAVDQRHRDRGDAGTLQQNIALRNSELRDFGVGPFLLKLQSAAARQSGLF